MNAVEISRWDVWVVSEKTGEWERYTYLPFVTKDQALRWAKRYIPNAVFEARSQ